LRIPGAVLSNVRDVVILLSSRITRPTGAIGAYRLLPSGFAAAMSCSQWVRETVWAPG
jgi:hypothetical protein